MPDQRGVSVSLLEPVTPTDPTALLHYEKGRVTYRQFSHHGAPWLATYTAEHDGIGWLVTKSAFRPLVLMPGDYVLVRFRVEEDHGDEVMVSVETKRGRITRPMPRPAIVHLEEGCAPIEPE
jgi:hypothetical protein